MLNPRLIRRFRADENGTTIIEFAVVGGLFFMMMVAIIEFGLIMMTKIAIEGVAQQISRSSGVNPATAGCTSGSEADKRVCLITKLLTTKTNGLINPSYVLVTSTVVSSKATQSPPIPDMCLDTVGVPSPASCTKYLNNDGVPGYQKASNINSGQVGLKDEIVEIRISYPWRILFPFMRPFFKNGSLILSSTTTVRNEPTDN